MDKEQTNKQLNFELLRIISMIMILILHFNFYTGFIKMEKFNIIFSFLEHACIIAVNIYVLITGYFLIKSKISLKKILKLELEVLFYSIIIYIIMVLIGQHQFNIKEFILYFAPCITKKYWFFLAYIGLYLIAPYLNILANSINRRQYRNLLIITALIFIIALIVELIVKLMHKVYPKVKKIFIVEE